jgi:hypothetical protein
VICFRSSNMRNGIWTMRPHPAHRASMCVMPLFSNLAMVRVSMAILGQRRAYGGVGHSSWNFPGTSATLFNGHGSGDKHAGAVLDRSRRQSEPARVSRDQSGSMQTGPFPGFKLVVKFRSSLRMTCFAKLATLAPPPHLELCGFRISKAVDVT